MPDSASLVEGVADSLSASHVGGLVFAVGASSALADAWSIDLLVGALALLAGLALGLTSDWEPWDVDSAVLLG